MNGLARPAGFYRTLVETGTVVCRLCDAPGHAHAPACPVWTLATQVRELTAQVGLFVATMRETTEALERLLRGDAGDGTGDGR
jgi:hypothetical protein